MAQKTLNLQVRYVAATKPFVEPHASPDETLQSVKAKVLAAFDLKEIQDGNQTILYFLYKDDKKLENLSITLGQLAEDAHELKLRLVQQIVQGDGVAQLDLKCFEADLAEVRATEEVKRWDIKQTPDSIEITVCVSSIKELAEIYIARLRWDRYPANPPSLKFVDANGTENNPRAWPQCAGFRPASLDACVNWTREGFGLHPDWAKAPATRWDPRGNALFRALNLLQQTLDLSNSGRFKQ